MGYVRAYELGDETQLAPILRAADLAELTASSDLPAIDILRIGGQASAPSLSVIENDKVVAMFGVIPLSDKCGRVWLLGSDALAKNPLRTQFLRESKRHLGALFSSNNYSLLVNQIDERNQLHVRWLTWLGFTFIRRIPEYGPEHRPFLEFFKCVTQ